MTSNDPFRIEELEQNSILTCNYSIICMNIHEYYSASATAPLNVIETGLQAYIALGIQKSKLILGVPWYRNRISI